MNALRAPLTALPTQRKKCVYFLLDMADDFIDGFARHVKLVTLSIHHQDPVGVGMRVGIRRDVRLNMVPGIGAEFGTWN